MDIVNFVSLALNAIGTSVSVAGAVYNAKGHHKFALFLWVISNLILLVFFIGVATGNLVLNGGAWLQVGLYTIFCMTSSYGYWRIMNKEKQHGNTSRN